MTTLSWLRAVERTSLRPLGRWLRRLGGSGRSAGRIEALEHRLEALESLVRELTGLAWLRLDDQPDGQPMPGTSEPRDRPAPREAA